MSAPAPIRDPLIGTRIDGRYLVHGVLGRGGMGVVYDGEHEQLGRPVAIKVLGPGVAGDPVAVQRFLREARTASRLTHGNIVDVSDLGNLPDGRPYLVMPKLQGVDLSNLLQRQGPQTPRRTCELLRGAAAALDLIHAKGFVHRDVKPENLMHVVHDDGSEAVLLLDFGIVGLISPDSARLTAEGVVFGTPAYIAPEGVRGDPPGPRSDIYALATVAFELITGQPPFRAANVMRLLQLKLGQDAPSMSQVAGHAIPDEIEAVLRQSLARDPRTRHASAGAFIAALEAALQRTGAIAGPRAERLDTQARQRLQDGTGELELSLSEVPPPSAADDTKPAAANDAQAPLPAEARVRAQPTEGPARAPAAQGRPAPPPPTGVRLPPSAAGSLNGQPAPAALRVPPAAADDAPRQAGPKPRPPAAPPPSAAVPERSVRAPANENALQPAAAEPAPPPAAAGADAAPAQPTVVDPQPAPVAWPRPVTQQDALAQEAAPTPADADEPGAAPAPRTRAVRAGAAGLAVVLAALGGWALTRGSDTPRQHVVTPLPAAPVSPAVAAPESAPTTPQGSAPPPAPASPAPPTLRAKEPLTPSSTARKPEAPQPKPRAEAPTPQPTAATPSAADIIKQAQTELIQGHLILAADLYERAARTDPSSAAAFRGLGLVSERLGRKDDAIRALRRAISLAPADPNNALLDARVHKLEGSP